MTYEAHWWRQLRRMGAGGYLLAKTDRVEDGVWMSQPEAAHYLGIALIRIGVLIANDHLAPAENPLGQSGVTTASVETEKMWRANATIRAKSIRLLKDTIRWF
jgi:hypothetical protein